ncbi:MAG: shikimate kinase [Acidimicrobiia bacterium]|jgi:shikimate kinase
MWLIGMMGSGKSTVGAAVARRLGLEFFDTDEMVVARAGLSIPKIFETMGEKEFRELEREALSMVPVAGCVAATGGGAILDEENRKVIVASPPVVWLRAKPETLALRVGGGVDRPLLIGAGGEERLADILDRRSQIYREVATHVIDTDDRASDAVVEEVVSLWQR